ncbi:MAG TPA: serine hydrolase [Hanamia sp.]|nr:serine hydrolase [Hanamia sp.]
MSKKFFFIFFQLCFISSMIKSQGTNAENNKAKLIGQIDSILNSQVANDLIPGAVIQIKKDGKIIYKHAYGYAQKYDINHQLLNPAMPMNTATLFDMASLTKVIGTTTSIMLLVDRGVIKIDDPIGKYIKSFDTGAKKTITIRNLLTHTAGLIEWYPLFYFSHDKQTSYKVIGELPLKYSVGKQRHYSDLGFILLQQIIEKVSGMPLDQFEKQNIFIPLGMTHTMYNPLQHGRTTNIAATSLGNPYETRMVYDSSLGYSVKGLDPASWNGWRHYVLKGEVNDGNAWYANGGIAGSAGLFSTVDDMQKLVDMLMNKGKVGNKQFISNRIIDSFFVKDQFNNGLGWMMDTSDSFLKDGPEGTFGHTGFTGTSIMVIPKYTVSIILLINRQNMGLLKSGYYYNVSPVRKEIFEATLKFYQH